MQSCFTRLKFRDQGADPSRNNLARSKFSAILKGEYFLHKALIIRRLQIQRRIIGIMLN